MPIKHANTQQHPVVYDCPCHRHLNPPTSSSSTTTSARKTSLAKAKIDRTRIIPRTELASRIIAGENLVIYNSLVLDLTRWADKHPGGKLAVLHFVGRDATDEMDAYHSQKDLKRVGGFVVGRVDESEPYKPLTPPISLGLIHDPESATGWRKEGPGTRLYIQTEDLGGKDARGEGGYYPVLTREALEPFEDEVEVDVGGDGGNGLLEDHGETDDGVEEDSSSGSSSGSRVDTSITSPISLHPTSQIPRAEKIDLQREHARSLAYRQLRTRLERAGLFQAEGWHKGYAGDLARYTILAGLAAGFYFWSTSTWGLFCSAVFLGAFWHQLTFLAHDAGHTGITGKAGKDRLIGTVVANWVGGLSLSWWKDNHNIHHLVTNHPEHDPDIQHIPFFAISTEFFGNLWSTYYKRVMPFDGFSNMMVKVQHKVYYVVLAFARFNLYANSYGYLALKMPRNKWFAFELAGLVFFWTWFGMLLKGLDGWKMRVGYLLVSHIVTSPVHVQIVLSHFARSTADLGPSESFVSRQLRTTMDVVCNEWIEFFHGGLHLQVTHHLFPRIPRHNLRRASKLVKEYCKEQEIEYAEYSFTEGNKRVLGVLKDVADQVTLLTKVAEADARGELH